MSGYEDCRKRLEKLAAWYRPRSGQRNEATTRLHLVDCLFFGCLGWSQDEVVAEEPHGREFADYVFSAPRRVLIVEAKKEGDYFELPAGQDRLEYAIPALFRDYPNLRTAMEQVARYCQTRGVPFGAVTNGHQIVALVATRNDGLPPLQGKALVFPSLDFMLSRFLDLWQALSKPGIEEKKLLIRLVGDTQPSLPPKLAESIGGYPGYKRRNPFQTDLQIVSELVLEDVARHPDIESSFLGECYCPSGALSQYALISKSILKARYSALFEAGSPGPTAIPAVSKEGISRELVAESLTRRPLLLIGDVGAGKTAFIRHLVRVEAAALFQDAIALYIDFGSQATLAGTLRGFLTDEIDRQLREDHGIEVDERNFVRGVYDLDLKRFERGIYGDLKDVNPLLYKEKELAFLGQKLASKEEHLKHALDHISKGRRKQIVVFLDNADQRAEDVQQEVFLIAQELAERWPAMVFVALRPETFHRSYRTGVLSGYHPKAFTISPPRIDLVIRKRLAFSLRITRGEIPIGVLGEETLVRFRSLEKIIQVFLTSLEENERLLECIDNIAGGNVRLGLELVKGFFGSGHVDTHKIIQIYEEQRRYTVPLHEFLRAVIFGDCEHFDSARSAVANVFDVSRNDPREHFLLPLCVGELARSGGEAGEGGFVETGRLYERIQGLGFTPEQIDSAIVRGCRKKLIETAARRIPEAGQGMPAALRATTVGIYHAEKLTRLFAYVDAMIPDTPILDRAHARKIRDVQDIIDRLERAEAFREYLDAQWERVGEARGIFDWPSASADLKTDIERARRGATRDRS